MRKIKSLLIALVVGLFLTMPVSSQAIDISDVDGMLDAVLVGANGIVTSPMDVVAGILEGDRTYKLPMLDKVGDWAVGLSSGVIEGVMRATTGGADICLAPVAWLLDAAGNPLGIEFEHPMSPSARHVWFGPDTRAN